MYRDPRTSHTTKSRPGILGVWMRHARKLRGLTQQALANRCRIARSTIAQLEAGWTRGMRPELVRRVERVLA